MIWFIRSIQRLINAIILKFDSGMRRFLVDTRNQCTGVHESERNSNLEEPRDGEVPNPDHQQPEPNIGNVTSELDPNEILCDPALRYQYALEIQDQVRITYILKKSDLSMAVAG